MKILYLDLGMGAAGDMLSAALYELLDDDGKKEYLRAVNALGLEGVSVTVHKTEKCGITGTHMDVRIDGISEGEDDLHHDHEHHHEHDHEHHHEHDHEHHYEHDHHDHEHHGHGHHHSSIDSLEHTISHLNASESVKAKVGEIYRLIAGAESSVHGTDVSSVHFHEVGEKDALADIAGVCILMEMLSPDKIIASPVCTGFGKTKCAHGILPVPAPATALLLAGIPAYSGDIEGELCTPTGAALIKYFAGSFSGMPVMTLQKCGYGMGKKDFKAANCIRAMLGEEMRSVIENSPAGSTDRVTQLSCNIDDMTPEAVAFAAELMLREGALDVYTTNIGMKKGRQGIMMSVICRPEDADRFAALMFRHTATIGIRKEDTNRYVLDRKTDTVHSAYGDVRVKISEGYGVTKRKCEFEDISRIAVEKGITLDEVSGLCLQKMEQNGPGSDDGA